MRPLRTSHCYFRLHTTCQSIGKIRTPKWEGQRIFGSANKQLCGKDFASRAFSKQVKSNGMPLVGSCGIHPVLLQGQKEFSPEASSKGKPFRSLFKWIVKCSHSRRQLQPVWGLISVSECICSWALAFDREAIGNVGF